MITGPGGTPKWRLHATYDPVAARFTGLELTDERGAESFDRTEWPPSDVARGDRCHARPPALRRTLAAGADFIVRTGWTRLHLLAEDGASVWPGTRSSTASRPARSPSGRFPWCMPARVGRCCSARVWSSCACRRGPPRAGKPLQPLTVRSTGYLMLLTSLPFAVSAAEVLAAYRLRWQVELAFKRLKGLLGLDRLPAKSEPLARGWLLAHRRRHASDPRPTDRRRIPDPPGLSPSVPEAVPPRPVSLWCIAHALRDAFLATIRGAPTIVALCGARDLLFRHLRERPWRRGCQFLRARGCAPP